MVSDKCKQTCVKDAEKDHCLGLCMTTAITKDRATFTTCLGKCEGKTKYINKCPEYEFVDCSNLGGYDLKDKCHMKCLIKPNATDKESCKVICENETANNKFESKSDQYVYFSKC